MTNFYRCLNTLLIKIYLEKTIDKRYGARGITTRCIYYSSLLTASEHAGFKKINIWRQTIQDNVEIRLRT
jgi:hypothetical protein